jgi:hypothetical protein
MNHTPGPWKAIPRELRHSVVDPDGNLVADLKWRGNDKKDQHLADALLIAAAPELLKALENIMSVSCGDIDCIRVECKAARAAIAKATGDNNGNPDHEKIQR